MGTTDQVTYGVLLVPVPDRLLVNSCRWNDLHPTLYYIFHVKHDIANVSGEVDLS